MKFEAVTPSRGQFIAGGLAATAATFASINVIAAPTKTLVVGLDVPQTGPYSDQGADQLRAYRLAIAEINAKGGVMGMQIQETVGDDQTKAPAAVENARRMIERDGAVMITGGSSTATANAVSGLCQEKKTIFMATLTHGDDPTDDKCHYHTFRRYNNAHMSAQSLAKTLLTKYGTGRWFHITADYSWGHSVFDNLTAVVEPKGAKTVNNILTPLTTTDFSAALSQAQAAKPDVLVITQFGKDMVNCLNQAAGFGLTKSTKILVPLVDEYMAKGAGDNFDNVVTTAPFYWAYHAGKYPAAKKFVDAFTSKWGTPPSNGAECAYTNMYQWKGGIERAGSLDPIKFIGKMENYHFTATKEPEYWRAFDHQGINSVLVLEGLPVKDRKSPYAYGKVLEVHQGDIVAIPQSTSKCKIESA
ncbi:MAG: ABC transporter substrate-binding protein [Candidatus Eremiobacteraeota bacterium]|nr:ABC transporter substrate-binding protein [Candidatus Eremiobacteraeota bacterium]